MAAFGRECIIPHPGTREPLGVRRVESPDGGPHGSDRGPEDFEELTDEVEKAGVKADT